MLRSSLQETKQDNSRSTCTAWRHHQWRNLLDGTTLFTTVETITRSLATLASAWRGESVTADPEQIVFGSEPRCLQTTNCVFVERLTRDLLLFHCFQCGMHTEP
jgi:hypothetical protein